MSQPSDMSPPGIGPGTFVAIGGPSGVGKDSLIRYARVRLAGDSRFLFVRRTITRAPDALSEDNLGVDRAEFERQRLAGAFALSWSAHDLSYGLPIAIDGAIAAGRVVVANISRTVLPALRQRYANVLPIAVTADPAIVLDRLTARGRESAAAIARRARRTVTSAPEAGWIELRNSGPLNEAGDALIARLLDAAA